MRLDLFLLIFSCRDWIWGHGWLLGMISRIRFTHLQERPVGSFPGDSQSTIEGRLGELTQRSIYMDCLGLKVAFWIWWRSMVSWEFGIGKYNTKEALYDLQHRDWIDRVNELEPISGYSVPITQVDLVKWPVREPTTPLPIRDLVLVPCPYIDPIKNFYHWFGHTIRCSSLCRVLA